MKWISVDAALAIHEEQIAEHGGADGVRDIALLEGALARPRQHFEYAGVRPDAPALAALYAIGAACNHPFVAAGDAECVVHVLALASGEESDNEFAAWMRESARPTHKARP